MKPLTLISGVLLALASLPALAQQSVDKTLEVSAGTRVYLNNERGELEVITHNKDEVRIVGTLDKRVEDFIFEMRGNGVRIEVRTPEQNGWSYNGDDGSDLTLYMPATSPLKVEGVSMDVEASGLQGGADITSVSGDINLKKGAQRVLLKTVSGDINASELSGEVTLETVSGDIQDLDNQASEATYQAVSGDVTVRSSQLTSIDLQNVSGDVYMELPVINDARLKNVSGDVQLMMGLSDTGNIDASSVSGDLEFHFSGEVNANFDLKANAGGDIVNQLSNDKPTESRWGTSTSLDFKVGTGAARVKVSTVSGSIEIRRD